MNAKQNMETLYELWVGTDASEDGTVAGILHDAVVEFYGDPADVPGERGELMRVIMPYLRDSRNYIDWRRECENELRENRFPMNVVTYMVFIVYGDIK